MTLEMDVYLDAHKNEILQYARFIELDKGIEPFNSIRAAAFLITARHIPFFISPRLWVCDELYMGPRVYFTVWSQNSLDAIRFVEKWFFDTDAGDVYVKRMGRNVAMRHLQLSRSDFSGARTRAEYEKAVEGVSCLRNFLASMS